MCWQNMFADVDTDMKKKEMNTDMDTDNNTGSATDNDINNSTENDRDNRADDIGSNTNNGTTITRRCTRTTRTATLPSSCQSWSTQLSKVGRVLYKFVQTTSLLLQKLWDNSRDKTATLFLYLELST
jgi:hypothetical protein